MHYFKILCLAAVSSAIKIKDGAVDGALNYLGSAAVFATVDDDNDLLIDQPELSKALKNYPELVQALIDMWDEDGDGKWSWDEVAPYV